MARVTYSFTLDSERDRRLVRWLDGQGNKSAAIREGLESHLGGAGLTLGDVYRAVKDLERKIGTGAVVATGAGAEPEEEIPADVLDALDGLGL